MPTIVVDIDNDVVDRNPPWSTSTYENGGGMNGVEPAEASSGRGSPSSPNVPKPPPAGFNKQKHDAILKDLYRLVSIHSDVVSKCSCNYR